MTPMHDLLAPYLLGSLEEPEHRAFESHLLDCQQCQLEMADLETGLSMLANANAVTPPPELKQSVLSAIRKEEPETQAVPSRAMSRSWAARLLPVAAILVLVVGAYALFAPDSIERITGAPDATTVALIPSESLAGDPPASAQVVFSADEQGAVIEITGLAPPSGSNVYEMWLIDEGGAHPAGTFTPDSTGAVLVEVEGATQPGLVIGITEEPAGGSEMPTGDVLFAAEL